MQRSNALLCALTATLAACASAPQRPQPAAPRALLEVSEPTATPRLLEPAAETAPEPQEARPEEAAAPAPTAAPAPAAAPARPSGPRLGEDELALWRDPAFRRQFAESYLAETDIEPRVTVAEREMMQQVLELISANQLGQAADLLEKGRTDASSAVVDFTLANIHFQAEELEPAAAAYQKAVDKFPKFRRAWRNLGVIQVRLARWREAIPALTRVIELGGGDAVTYGLLGFAYSNEEDFLAAESAYRMAILLDPGTVDWKMGLARSLFKQERFSDAAALCGRLIADAADRADLWMLQANAYIGLGRPQDAAQNLELVDRMGRSTADSLNTLGDIYVNQGLYDLAVGCYGRALEKGPQAGVARALKAAKVLTAKGALHETRALVERVEGLRGADLSDAERKDVLKMRARLAVAEGAGDEEARVLEEIVKLDPLDGEALILLGQHCGRIGDLEKAVFYLERAEGLERFEADAKVRHAQLLVKQGRYAEALPLLRRAQSVQPRDNVQQYLEQVERIAQSR